MNLDSIGRWIRHRQKVVVVAAAVFQVGVLSAMTGITTARHWNAEIHYLRTAPVDPRDIFRGDYVVLSYPFSQAWRADAGDIPSGYSGPVFVPLKKIDGNKVSEPGRLSTHPPAEGPYLRGISQHGMIRFGIEQFFVQEGKGLRFEDAARRRQLIAKVSVPKDGQAMVLDLEIDPNGKELGPN
jgi:uncharacterized membrane-anchored protein